MSIMPLCSNGMTVEPKTTTESRPQQKAQTAHATATYQQIYDLLLAIKYGIAPSDSTTFPELLKTQGFAESEVTALVEAATSYNARQKRLVHEHTTSGKHTLSFEQRHSMNAEAWRQQAQSLIELFRALYKEARSEIKKRLDENNINPEALDKFIGESMTNVDEIDEMDE